LPNYAAAKADFSSAGVEVALAFSRAACAERTRRGSHPRRNLFA